MAMDKTVLATAIVDALAAVYPEIAGANRTTAINNWKIIADEIIKHIKANAQVTVTDFSGMAVTGIVNGGANSGPGTGTAIGQVTA